MRRPNRNSILQYNANDRFHQWIRFDNNTFRILQTTQKDMIITLKDKTFSMKVMQNMAATIL